MGNLRLTLCYLLLLLSAPVQSSYYVKNSYAQLDSSYNSVGQTGLIQIPTASLQKPGTVGISYGNGSLNKFFSIIATPFPWFEASFFYHRPRDTIYIKKNKYLDKGFNIKMGFKYKGFDLAMGLDDIAGTGFFSKEYIVATTKYNNINFTLGVGTGAFAAEHPYKNPIPGLRDRPEPLFVTENIVGVADFNSFFKGPVGIFGGIEYFSSRFPNITIKVENNPFNYAKFMGGGFPTQKFIERRKKEREFNYGISYKFHNNFVLSLSEINKNSFNLSLSAKFNFDKKKNAVKPKKVITVSNANNKKLALYQNILRNLEKR